MSTSPENMQIQLSDELIGKIALEKERLSVLNNRLKNLLDARERARESILNKTVSVESLSEELKIIAENRMKDKDDIRKEIELSESLGNEIGTIIDAKKSQLNLEENVEAPGLEELGLEELVSENDYEFLRGFHDLIESVQELDKERLKRNAAWQFETDGDVEKFLQDALSFLRVTAIYDLLKTAELKGLTELNSELEAKLKEIQLKIETVTNSNEVPEFTKESELVAQYKDRLRDVKAEVSGQLETFLRGHIEQLGFKPTGEEIDGAISDAVTSLLREKNLESQLVTYENAVREGREIMIQKYVNSIIDVGTNDFDTDEEDAEILRNSILAYAESAVALDEQDHQKKMDDFEQRVAALLNHVDQAGTKVMAQATTSDSTITEEESARIKEEARKQIKKEFDEMMDDARTNHAIAQAAATQLVQEPVSQTPSPVQEQPQVVERPAEGVANVASTSPSLGLGTQVAALNADAEHVKEVIRSQNEGVKLPVQQPNEQAPTPVLLSNAASQKPAPQVAPATVATLSTPRESAKSEEQKLDDPKMVNAIEFKKTNYRANTITGEKRSEMYNRNPADSIFGADDPQTAIRDVYKEIYSKKTNLFSRDPKREGQIQRIGDKLAAFKTHPNDTTLGALKTCVEEVKTEIGWWTMNSALEKICNDLLIKIDEMPSSSKKAAPGASP